MYAFEPSEEQKMLIDAIQRFSINDLRPAAHDADENEQFSKDLIEKGWELGVLQASIPEEYGGFGDHSAVTGALAAEELALGDIAGAFAILAPGLFALPILFAGDQEQRQQYLGSIIESEWKPFTAALVEPRFDFDPNDLQTEARETNDGYVLNGDVGDRQPLLGVKALPLNQLSLNDVHIPKENRLGGSDGHDFNLILASSRIAIAALGVGLSRAAFEYARDYAKDREVFGVKVAQKQSIAFMLAEMATEIESIRLLTWEAAWMLDEGKEDASKYAYLAHTGATNMAMMVTDRAVQILGGHGYIREHPVEMWMRSGRGIATFTGLAMI
jgi:alkylation response protein AidB-like acyl-CoA dehydrogenase